MPSTWHRDPSTSETPLACVSWYGGAVPSSTSVHAYEQSYAFRYPACCAAVSEGNETTDAEVIAA